jgi:GcrA cell cycle regulator
MSAWNEVRTETLTRLWSKGWSASQIAAQMGGTTRNAVISKARRLGLPYRKGEYGQRQVYFKPRICNRRRPTPHVHPSILNRAVSKLYALPPPTRTEAVETVFVGERLSLLELTENTCRWPIGDPREADFHFCGRQKSGNGPYCEHHARIAFQPYVPRGK